MTADILSRLDLERRAAGELTTRGEVVREYSPDRSECTIVYSRCAAEEIDEVIQNEISLAEAQNYRLEWKVYGHDPPLKLRERLLAAGFEMGPEERLMVLRLTEAGLAAFDAPAYDVRRILDADGLKDVAAISREIGRPNVEEEQRRLALILQNSPDQMSVHLAYVDSEPVACGRIHFKRNREFAELAGGRTRTTHRNQGFHTALVASRLGEALERSCHYVLVDALPTSAPMLDKRGFRYVTSTQPFVYRPGSGTRPHRWPVAVHQPTV